MSYLVTGGSGFIGSCVVAMLNRMGIDDIILADNINTSEKWLNIRNKRYREYVHKDNLWEFLSGGGKKITHIIHLGACSATTETDFDYLYENNYRYSVRLWEYAARHHCSFLYASSAATYGDGNLGFNDKGDIRRLLPLNRYGYSKQLFDLWAAGQEDRPGQAAGLKFFNVYGPNEYAKKEMASVIYHGYRQIKETGKIKLFKSYHPDYADGGQLRDFVYVKDVCNVIRFLLENRNVNGLFNVGTGRAQSFKELACGIFHALGKPDAEIEFIDMPLALRDKYQYFTQADMGKLREAGYTGQFADLGQGISDYVSRYLEQGCRIY